MEIDPESVNRVVAIVMYGRSGSIFLQSLFDSHPQILMVPGYLSGFFEFWSLYGELSPQKVIDKFCWYYPVLFDAAKPSNCLISRLHTGKELGFTAMGHARKECLRIDKQKFVQCMREMVENCSVFSRRFFFQAVHCAYAKCLGRKVSGKDLILMYQFHEPNQRRAMELVRDFPDTLFLLPVRNPIQSLGSSLVYSKQLKHLHVDLLLWYVNNILMGGGAVLAPYKERTRCVKLEDLHTNPRDAMKKLVQWMGIAWDSCLLESTFDGLQWWNLKNGAKISGFNKTVISKSYEHIFPPNDRERLQQILYEYLITWKYAQGLVLKKIDIKIMTEPYKMESLLPWWESLFFKNRRLVSSYFEGIVKKIKYRDRPAELLDPGSSEQVTLGWLKAIPDIEGIKSQKWPKGKKEFMYYRLLVSLPYFVKWLANRHPALIIDLMKILKVRNV